MYPLQGDLLSVTLDPETAKIRLLIVTQHLVAIALQLSSSRNVSTFTMCMTLAAKDPTICRLLKVSLKMNGEKCSSIFVRNRNVLKLSDFIV